MSNALSSIISRQSGGRSSPEGEPHFSLLQGHLPKPHYKIPGMSFSGEQKKKPSNMQIVMLLACESKGNLEVKIVSMLQICVAA